MRSKKSGFTLIELLVVIAIIGILVALLLPSLNRIRLEALRTEVAVTIRNVSMAVEMYEKDEGAYPPSEGQGNNFSTTLGGNGGNNTDGALVRFLDGRADNDDNKTPTRAPIQYFEFPDIDVVAGVDADHPIFQSRFQRPFFYNELRTDNLLNPTGDAVNGNPAAVTSSSTFRKFQIFNQADALDTGEDDRFICNFREP